KHIETPSVVRTATATLRRLQPAQPVPSAVAASLALGADRNTARPTLQNRRPRSPDRPLHPLPPRQRLALPEPVPLCRLRRQQRLTRVLIHELTFHPQLLRSRAQNLSARHLYPLGPHTLVLLTPLIAQSLPTNTLANQNPSPHELSRLGKCKRSSLAACRRLFRPPPNLSEQVNR